MCLAVSSFIGVGVVAQLLIKEGITSQATLFLEDKTRAWRLHPNTRNQAMGMLEVTCVPAIMEETLIREYTVNLPTLHNCGFYPTGALP